MPKYNPMGQAGISGFHIGHTANVPPTTVDRIKAWERMNAVKSSGYRVDVKGLNALDKIIKSAAAVQTLGGQDGLDIILKKNGRLPCNTCNNSQAKPYLNPMDKYLADVQYFADNFKDKPGAGKVTGNQGMKNGSLHQVEATAFMLRVLREHPEYRADITGFEEIQETVNEDGETNTAFADIVKKGNVLVECKSWALEGLSFDKFVKGESGSFQQFKTYLSQINSLSELEYWFDERKLPAADARTEVKKKFQNLMYDKNANNGQGGLTTSGEDVFMVIWGNVGLRATLFTGITDINVARDKLIDMTEQITSIFYSFINLK